MRKFSGTAANDFFTVGCTGRTVYVFDRTGNELAKFRDIPYGYRPLLCPKQNILAVKSNAGWLAFYNLDHLSLIKKIRFSKQLAQDSGFCFSKDGKYLYNLENIDSDLSYEIARYDLNTIERATIIPSRPKCIFRQIGYSAQLHTYCILGTTHCTDTLFTQTGPFIAYFNGQEITDVYSVTEHEDYNHFMQLTTEINSNCVTSSSINKENTYGQN